MKDIKSKKMAIVVAIEDTHSYEEQERKFLETIDSSDKKLLEDLKHLYELEPNNAVFRKDENGNITIYIIDPIFSFSKEDDMGFEPLAFVLFSILEIATEYGCKKLVMPTLNGWNAALDKKNTAEATLRYLQYYMEKERKNFDEIIIRLNNRETYIVFSEAVEKFKELPIKLEEVQL